jgi:hypothetical protein
MTDTFTGLLRDRAHWEFEIFLMLLFDGVIAGLLFPLARRAWKRHIEREEKPWYVDVRCGARAAETVRLAEANIVDGSASAHTSGIPNDAYPEKKPLKTVTTT